MRSFSGRESREQGDANVICLGERVSGPGLALESIHRFLASELSGATATAAASAEVLVLEAAFGAPQGD
jgi:ribose 5-phosphate isomerase RpiB